MAFQSSHSRAFGYDMNASHLNYGSPQQAANQHTEYYPDSKRADQAINNVAMMPSNSQNSEFRRDSLASNSGVLSPVGSSWEHKQLYPSAGFAPSHAFHEAEHAGFVQHDQTPVYPHAPQEWIMSPAGSVDTSGFEQYPTKFETSPFPGSLPSDQANFASIQQDHGFNQAPHVQTPAETSMSPPAHNWTDMLGPKGHKAEKPLKPRHQPILKRDGIRKKNAKIPIPAEITLENIDDLIENCTDEEEMKQLKAQKRLLRNREAALASRQRKKKHTEHLEAKEKDLEGKILMLCQQVDALKLELRNAESQKRFYVEEHAKASETVQALHMEKEDLICKHTQETGNLRHQIRFLREQLESSPAPAMSAAPSSTGFTDNFNLEMDHLQLEDQPWDAFINVHDSNDLESSEYLGNTADSFATIKPKHPSQQEAGKSNPVDQPVTSGILFMLLLCGAFVASRSATTTTRPVIPKMPEEVRAASNEVLNNLLKDNPREASLFLPDMPQMQSPTGSQQTGHRPSLPTQWSSQPSVSHIGALHERLTSPSKLQEAEQAFSLTPAQYNSLAYPSMSEAQPLQEQSMHRSKNLAETLKTMNEARGNMAAVYTRSLLMDQIPEDVVRRFRQMVAESHANDAEAGDDYEMHDQSASQHPYEMTQ